MDHVPIRSPPFYNVRLLPVLVFEQCACFILTNLPTWVQFQARVMMSFLLLSAASRPALGFTQPRIQWVGGEAISTGGETARA